MFRKSKKIVAVLLTVVMLIGIMPISGAFAADNKVYPTIYIEGQGYTIVDENNNNLYPGGVDGALSGVMENLKPLVKEAAMGLISGGDYSNYTKMLYDLMAPAYENVILNKDGTPKAGTQIPAYAKWNGNAARMKEALPMTNGYYTVYRWHYDWRLSPVTLADELDEIVNAVLASTGAEKVNIISRCLGVNVAYAYLVSDKYDAASKVNSFVMYASALEGLGVLDALFTGEVVLDAGAVDRFVTYYKERENIVIGDEATTELIFSLVELFEEVSVLGMGLDAAAKLVNSIYAQAGPEILKATYGGFLGYWAMVSPEKYEKAKNFIFATDEEKEEYAGFIALADEYHEISLNMEEKLMKLSEDVDIAVVTKYGLPDLPLSADAGVDSDGFVAADIASFGATVTDLDKKFSDKYIAEAKEKGTDKYIGADGKIDASTCLFPDTTWFVKGLPHRDFPECVNDLMIEFVNNSDTMTVWTNPAFTQYLQFTATNTATSDYTKGTLTPIVSAEDTNDTTEDYTKSPLQALFRFLAKLLNFLKNLFSGNKG